MQIFVQFNNKRNNEQYELMIELTFVALSDEDFIKVVLMKSSSRGF